MSRLTVQMGQDWPMVGGPSASWEGHRIVPTIPLLDREDLWRCWPEVNPGAVSLSYIDLKSKKSIYTRAGKVGIKKTLGYNGKVACLLGGDNWQLDKSSVSTYAKDVDAMGFDAATTSEGYVYITDQENQRRHQLDRIVERAHLMTRVNPKTEIIGMAQGTNHAEIAYVLRAFRDLGLTWVVYPCGPLLAQRIYHPIHEFLRTGRDFGMRLWLTGVNSLRSIRKLRADTYSGKKWCYGAAHRTGYSRGVIKKFTMFHCAHTYCHEPTTLPFDVRLARHNMLTLMDEDKNTEMESHGWW